MGTPLAKRCFVRDILVLGLLLQGPGLAVAGPNAGCRRGDADGDGQVVLTDAIVLLSFLFRGGAAPRCTPIGDSNGDGQIDVSDAVFTLLFLFAPNRPAPPPLSAAEQDLCCGMGPDLVERGNQVYAEPDPERPIFARPYACATCHDKVPESEARFLRPGASLHDAVRRPSYKLGQLSRFLDAANVCRTDWMQVEPWEETDPDFVALEAFLESIAPPGAAPAVVYEIVEPSRQGPATGNPQAGCELFHRSCVVCHGEGAQGIELLAPSLVAFLLGDDYVRLKIRLSGPSRVANPETIYAGLRGGVMPFWGAERLTDSDVEDLAAYLNTRPVLQCGN